MQKTPYDPLSDFTYIIHLSGFMFGVGVRADCPFKTFKDMIELVARQSGQAHLRHAGRRHLAAYRHGADRAARPASSGPWCRSRAGRETWAALEGGHVMAAAEGAGWWPLRGCRQGRVLVLWTEQRNPRLPDTPTLQGAGLSPSCSTPPSASPAPRAWTRPSSRSCTTPSRQPCRDPKAMEIQKRYDYVNALHEQRRLHPVRVANRSTEQKTGHRAARARRRKTARRRRRVLGQGARRICGAACSGSPSAPTSSGPAATWGSAR